MILLLWVPSLAQAQQEFPLREVLDALEERYEVDFNYDPQILEGMTASLPESNLTLEEALVQLRSQTLLEYHFLDSTTVSVIKRSVATGVTLCGYLQDKDDQTPLAFANVQVGRKATITNEEGYFELVEVDPQAQVQISYLGYKTLNRQAKFFKRSCEPIYMVANQQQLGTVYLQQYLVKGVDRLTSGEYRIDFDKFSALPGLIEADVLQAVQALPGIQSVDETVSDINIRGGTHDQNLILWDGIKMYQSGHFFGLISVFNPQMNQEVRLTQNGTDPQLTDGVSGTIAMKTAQRINPKFKANVGINLVNADVFFDIPVTANSSLQLAGRKSLSDLFATPTFDAYFDRISQNTEVTQQQENTVNTNQNFEFYDTSLRYLHRISDKDHLRANFLLINNKLVFDENTVLDSGIISRQSQVSQNSVAAGLQYNRDWSERFSTALEVYNTDYILEAINANIELSQRFLQENSVSETGIKALAHWQFNSKFKWSSGYQFIETKVRNLDDVDNPVVRNLSGEVVRIHAAFTNLSLADQNTNWSGNIGGRYSYIPKFDAHIVEPRLRLAYAITPEFSAEAMGEFKHQVTTQIINFQNDFLGVERRRWRLANDSTIPIVQSKQGSFGLNYKKEDFLIGATGFYKEVDGVTARSQGFLNQFEFEEGIGSYTAYGLDFLVRKNIWRLQLWSSYSYLQNTYDFPTLLEESFPSNFDISHTVTAGLAYDYKGFKASVGINWRTGRPFTLPDPTTPLIEDEVNYGFPNQNNLDEFIRLDASASYRFTKGRLRFQVAASVWNLTNRKNVLNRFFEPVSTQVVQVDQNSLGLVPNFSLRMFY
ncbi:TonB-dependent receptor [Gilvibacter sediminis]|uniref:TonB-dependent receptor n=1 Tax=Gilvibacter sediminis TaxID=379071 RepID=UPI00234FBE63|nr:carboxypeptidase-like regulatory domain-containing protein [Gilvibacter sediminis]MDC7999145.1 carboxypeptidase-like regulatory domain-containing protein [Gilvibacter sediminis]